MPAKTKRPKKLTVAILKRALQQQILEHEIKESAFSLELKSWKIRLKNYNHGKILPSNMLIRILKIESCFRRTWRCERQLYPSVKNSSIEGLRNSILIHLTRTECSTLEREQAAKVEVQRNEGNEGRSFTPAKTA